MAKRVNKSKKAPTPARNIAKINREIAKLQAELTRLSKTKSKQQLKQFNAFMRRQLNAGTSFTAALRAWNTRNSASSKTPSATAKKTKPAPKSKKTASTKTKTPAKRSAKTPAKAKAASKPATARIRKQLSVQQKRARQTTKRLSKVSQNQERLQSGMKRLQQEIDSLQKRKTSKKQLNEYNLFMRRQLREGKSFAQAVSMWKRVKKFESGKLQPAGKPSPKTMAQLNRLQSEMAKLKAQKTPKKQLNEYNLFMRRHLNEGKTFNQAVQLWKRVKKAEKTPQRSKRAVKSKKTPVGKKAVQSKKPVRKKSMKTKKPVRKKTAASNVPVRKKSKPAGASKRKRKTAAKPVTVVRTRVKRVTVKDPALETALSRMESDLSKLKKDYEEKMALSEKRMRESIEKKEDDLRQFKISQEEALRSLSRKSEDALLDQRREYEEQLLSLQSELSKAKTDAAALQTRAVQEQKSAQKHAEPSERISVKDDSEEVISQAGEEPSPKAAKFVSELPREELAYRMVKVFFEEVARVGFKRSLSLDDLVNAYFFARDRVDAKMSTPADKHVSDDEIAYRITHLYFIELARIGVKRTIDLEELLNAYFYVLEKIAPKQVMAKTEKPNAAAGEKTPAKE